MKRITRRYPYPTYPVFAAVAFFVIIAFGGVNFSFAAADDPAQKPPRTSKVDRTEARIKDLHARLKITPAQEELWNKVTQVMRENAKTMDALIQARIEKAKTMNTVEDLKSYSEITQAHADGLKKFIPVFEELYAGMSEEQKKDADTLFRFGDRRKSKSKK